MSFFDVLDEMQTSFVMISALIPDGLNKQLKGHLEGMPRADRADGRCVEQRSNEG
jgi:hypothetical protein